MEGNKEEECLMGEEVWSQKWRGNRNQWKGE
jgi:hypothetical protein